VVVPHVILAASLFVLFVAVGLLQTEFGLVSGAYSRGYANRRLTVMASLRTVRARPGTAAMSLGAGYVRNAVPRHACAGHARHSDRALLAFVTSFDETTLAIFLGGVQSTTLPMKMWDGITVESIPSARRIHHRPDIQHIAHVAIEIWRRLRDRQANRRKGPTSSIE